VTPCNLVYGYRYFITCAGSIIRVEGNHLYRKEGAGNVIRTINISKSKETVRWE